MYNIFSWSARFDTAMAALAAATTVAVLMSLSLSLSIYIYIYTYIYIIVKPSDIYYCERKRALYLFQSLKSLKPLAPHRGAPPPSLVFLSRSPLPLPLPPLPPSRCHTRAE